MSKNLYTEHVCTKCEKTFKIYNGPPFYDICISCWIKSKIKLRYSTFGKKKEYSWFKNNF